MMNDFERKKMICEILCKNAQGTILQTIIKDPQKGKSILSDWFPDAKLERNILTHALMEKIPALLLDNNNNALPVQVKIAQAVQKLRESSGLSEENALWGVECWAMALGKLSANSFQSDKIQSSNNPSFLDSRKITKADSTLPVPVKSYSIRGIASMGIASSFMGAILGFFLFPQPDIESLSLKEKLEKKIIEVNSELLSQTTELDLVKENSRKANEILEISLKEKKSLTQKMLDLESENKILMERSAMNNLDANALKKRLAETSRKNLQEGSKIETLQKSQNEVEKELVNLRQELTSTSQNSNQKELDLFKMEQEKLVIAQSLVNKKAELTPLESEISKTGSELKKIKLEISELSAATKKINAEKQSLIASRKKPVVKTVKKSNPPAVQVRANKTTSPVVIKKNSSSFLNLLDVGSRDR